MGWPVHGCSKDQKVGSPSDYFSPGFCSNSPLSCIQFICTVPADLSKSDWVHLLGFPNVPLIPIQNPLDQSSSKEHQGPICRYPLLCSECIPLSPPGIISTSSDVATASVAQGTPLCPLPYSISPSCLQAALSWDCGFGFFFLSTHQFSGIWHYTSTWVSTRHAFFARQPLSWA